jgi:hypothetical protein
MKTSTHIIELDNKEYYILSIDTYLEVYYVQEMHRAFKTVIPFDALSN